MRVIAATNKNLEEEIDKGTFREDLFYRLNVVPIHVPPLRERRDDIPALVRHFADLFARDNNFHRKTLHRRRMERLKQQHWRGNIRELRNIVERLMIMTHRRRDRRAATLPEGGADPRRRAAAAGAGGAAAPADAVVDAGGDAAGVQGRLRARVPGGEAARERLEHLEDGRSDRHAAQQSVQEARAVPDFAGEGRLTN